MSDRAELRRAAHTKTCPECGGRLAQGGAALSCVDCDWKTSLEDTAAILGWD